MEKFSHSRHIKLRVRELILHKLIKLRHERIILRREHILFKLLHICCLAEHSSSFLSVLEQGSHQSQYILRLERLGHICICTAVQPPYLIIHRSHSCQQNDRNMRELNILLYLLAEIVSCLVRHNHIGNHHIRSLFLHEHICSVSIEAGENIVLMRKHFLEVIDDICVIIHHKNNLLVLIRNLNICWSFVLDKVSLIS